MSGNVFHGVGGGQSIEAIGGSNANIAPGVKGSDI